MITRKIATVAGTATLAAGLGTMPAAAHGGHGGWQGSQNQGGTASGGVLQVPCQTPRHLMRHDRRGRRQVDQASVVSVQPAGEGPVKDIPHIAQPGLMLKAGAAMDQGAELGPFQGKGNPVRVTGVRLR